LHFYIFRVFLLDRERWAALFYREAMLQRISEVINPQEKKTKTLLSTIQQTGLSIGGVVEHFENVLPKSQAEVSVVTSVCSRAGFRKSRQRSRSSMALKYCSTFALRFGAGYRVGERYSPFFVITLCLGLGFLCPGFLAGKANQLAPG
jgi:tight adherence protein C